MEESGSVNSTPDKGGASKWQRIISDTLESDACKKNMRRIRDNRIYLSGEVKSDTGIGMVRTNLLFSSMATMIPYTYAKDPDVSVVPAESTDPDMYPVTKAFTETLQSVLHKQLFADGKLKQKVRAALRSEWCTALGAMKIVYQRDMETDPIIQNRINDAQDNVTRLIGLIESTNDKTMSADYQAEMEELKLQISALEKEVEVVSAEGLCIDNIMSEDLLILDDTVKVFEDYPNARAIAHGIWYEKEEYMEVFGKGDKPNAPLHGAHVFSSPEDDRNNPRGSRPNTTKEFVRVWEIWDKTSLTVYTICQGAQGYCREPYQPERTGERWYPIFLLGFNNIDGQFLPLASVGLGRELQIEYNETRDNYAEHRREDLPVRVFRSGGNLDAEDINALKNRRANDWVPIKGNPQAPIQQDIAILPNPPINPETYDTSVVRNDLDLMYGLSDASRSVLIEAKTATEAGYLREGMQARTSDRRGIMEDCIKDMSQYSAEILLQELTIEQAKQLAGNKAVWPELYKPQIFNLVSIEISAGSSGKPDKQGEQERWIKIMPLIKDSILEIKTLEAQGAIDVAGAYRMLLEETLSRFDERLDINAYLGPKPERIASSQEGISGSVLPPQPMMPAPDGTGSPPIGGPPGAAAVGLAPPMRIGDGGGSIEGATAGAPPASPLLPMPAPAPASDSASLGLIGGNLAILANEISQIKASLSAGCGQAMPMRMPEMSESIEIKRMDDGTLVGRRGMKLFTMRRQEDGRLEGTVTSIAANPSMQAVA